MSPMNENRPSDWPSFRLAPDALAAATSRKRRRGNPIPRLPDCHDQAGTARSLLITSQQQYAAWTRRRGFLTVRLQSRNRRRTRQKGISPRTFLNSQPPAERARMSKSSAVAELGSGRRLSAGRAKRQLRRVCVPSQRQRVELCHGGQMRALLRGAADASVERSGGSPHSGLRPQT
jgi:hypothetical protein